VPTVSELNEERARLVRRLREMHAARERGEDWDDDEEIRVSRAITALEAQITELGGTIEPVPRDEVPAPSDGGSGDAVPESGQPDGGRPAGATTHLGAPPDSIDEQWNDLVDAYEKAQQDVADHAMSERDDWTCTHADPRVHGGCAIWWRGELENLLGHLRDRANQLLDHEAGPRTEAEFRNDGDLLRLRERELAPLEKRIRDAEERLARLLEQFTEDEKTYKAVRDAGGDVAPFTGIFSAARSRLLFDIAELQQELTRLYGERMGLLTRLRELQRRAGAVRRNRGLGRANERWPDLFLDLDSLTDEELLRRLLGDEQYRRMTKERHRQGTQIRRQRTRRTSMSTPLMLGMGVLVLVLLVVVVAVVASFGRNPDGDDDLAGAVGDDFATSDDLASEDAPADEIALADPGQVDPPDGTPAAIECVLVTDLELDEIIVEPGSHHQGNVVVLVVDSDGEPVEGAEVAIETDKSDGTQTEASGTTQAGRVIFGMVTTAYGPNTLTVTRVAMPGCTWSPEGERTLTWDAEP
jgi:hypothetical protein